MSDKRIFFGNPLDISLDIALKIAFLDKKIIPRELLKPLILLWCLSEGRIRKTPRIEAPYYPFQN